MSRGFVIWLTGLSGAGKSTIANRLDLELRGLGRTVSILDGDEVRTHLSKGLGFSKEDRDTNIRRIGYVAGLVARHGGVAITAAISPYREVRDELRAAIPNFVEVYVRCPLEELIRRDAKGLYARALAGEISNFTGVNDPYEEPLHPEVVVDTGREAADDSVSLILTALERLGHVWRGPRERLLLGEEAAALRHASRDLPGVEIGPHETADALMLGTGALSPLSGFMGAADYRSVITEGRLSGGHPFPIPVLLRIDGEAARRFRSAPRIALRRYGEAIALVDIEEIYRTDPEREALAVYATDETAHPGVRLLRGSGTWAVGGTVTALARPSTGFAAHDLTPLEVRQAKQERGWRTMVGFQTRNPVHRAHEYLQKVALENIDGLLLHPLVGETKSDDIPAATRMACYEALLAGYYPPERVLLATNPAWMRYAGPREAVFHAVIRRNYGCTHFIVGRDHAGVGSYYDTYAAHRIFDEYRPEELGIEILRFEHSFWCRTCGGMASTRTCPHPAAHHAALSGTRVRELLALGHSLPEEFTRPEVGDILARRAAAIDGHASAPVAALSNGHTTEPAAAPSNGHTTASAATPPDGHATEPAATPPDGHSPEPVPARGDG
ncbi:MAG TPA: sulfate adenylyltransferase [Candidatus Binatia bacterium]|nr:sulfate adenylyltransferase [Candidatus Binatia bacterium]